ncbi:hypothetical protein SNE40_005310 [Patella caerulea]|uniref:Uncharacterized protein n=1 Tax=Patella caerulea TaxID=87958 RepID=A0AAN8PXB0_PATCE
MRPGLHGNLLRNRGQRSRRLHNRPHTFSLSRLLMMVFVGAIMFIPGLALTIIGLQTESLEKMAPGERIMYRALGPAMCVLGIGTLFGAAVYYCCYAVGSPNTRQQGGSSNHCSMVSGDSERHKHHHHHHGENGHSGNTSDHAHTHRRASYNRQNDDHDSRVPLAYIDDDTLKEPLSPVAIQIDSASDNQGAFGLDIPEVRISPCSSYQGSILNGEIRSSSPT